MRYLSVCSGIESATVAWHSMGWQALAYSEIEPFPCKVLAHHYPDVPNLGDMTKFKEWSDYANVDVLVGGTPCQSFSVAGLRKGLNDPRGNLMLTYLAIADKYRPKYLVWENVPGVLSSNGGKDFGTFLAGLGELGYGFAYRVLDAQYCRTHEYAGAVPQRRRRVFVVGCIGDWRRAAAVLFDSESLRGNPPPSRKARESIARTVIPSVEVGRSLLAKGNDSMAFDLESYVTHSINDRVSPTINAAFGSKLGLDNQHIDSGAGLFVYALAGNTIGRKPENGGNGTGFDDTGSSYTLTKTDVHTVAFTARDYGNDASFEVTPTMRSLTCGADGHQSGSAGLAVAYRTNAAGQVMQQGEVSATINTFSDPTAQFLQTQMQVRRLTPRECERLQGFPDDYTNILGASDTTRYKALGNSMAVNVMQIIGQRIQMAESIKQKEILA